MNMPSPTRVVGPSLALAALLSVAGCATKGDVRDLSEQIRDLAVRQDSVLVELRLQSAATQDTLRTTSDALFDIRGDVMQGLAAIRQELARLTEITGENQRTISLVRDQMDAMRRTGVSRGGASPAGDLSGGVPVVGGDADAMFKAAMEQFNRGLLVSARTGFNDFLSAFPDDQLAPTAHYHLGDILVQENRQREAIDQFSRIPELFPTDEKVPDALYRIGVIHLDLGERDEARGVFQRIVNSYPESAVAPMAEERLREIGEAS